MTEWSGMNRGALDLAQSVDQPQTLINPRLWRGGELSRRLGMARSNIDRQDGPILGISGFSPRPSYPGGGLFQNGEWSGFTEQRALWGGGTSGGTSNYTFAAFSGTGYWRFFWANGYDAPTYTVTVGSSDLTDVCQPIYINGKWHAWSSDDDCIRQIESDGSITIVAYCGDIVDNVLGMLYNPTTGLYIVFAGTQVYQQTGYATWSLIRSAQVGWQGGADGRGHYVCSDGANFVFKERDISSGYTDRVIHVNNDGSYYIAATATNSLPIDHIRDCVPGAALSVSASLPGPSTIVTNTASGKSYVYDGNTGNGITANQTCFAGDTAFDWALHFVSYAHQLSEINGQEIASSYETGIANACGVVLSTYTVVRDSGPDIIIFCKNGTPIIDLKNNLSAFDIMPLHLVVAEL